MARGSFISIDGSSSVNQGAFGVVRSRGSQQIRCDLDSLINWWGDKTLAEIAPIPFDKHGEPMRMCNQGHYAPKDDFGKRNGAKDHICLKCRKLQRLNHMLYKSG